MDSLQERSLVRTRNATQSLEITTGLEYAADVRNGSRRYSIQFSRFKTYADVD